MNIRRARAARVWLALAAASLLAGCGAALQPTSARIERVRLNLPPGDWRDLGDARAALPLRAVPTALPLGVAPAAPVQPLQTRAVGLLGAKGEWLAVLLVRANQYEAIDEAAWGGKCATQRDVQVTDFAQGSPVRIDCLRYKSWADRQDWLRAQDPALTDWLTAHAALPGRPYVYLDYRYTTSAGAYVEVAAVVDQRRLHPATRSNDEFMRAGTPLRTWALALRDAVRDSVSYVDGYLAVPPFPLPAPN